MARRETFHNVAHQLQCLNRCFNVLRNRERTADTKNRAFILRKLKCALRTQYKECFPLPPPDQCTVLLLFDPNDEDFFETRLKPKAWPMNWPTGLDLGTADGMEIALLSQTIYEEVLKAFNAENELPQNFGAVSSSGRSNSGSGGRGQRSSVDEKNGSRTDIIRVKSEKKEILIGDEEEEEEEKEAENNVHTNEQTVNRRASADGHVNNSDLQRQQHQQQQQQGDMEESEE